MDIYVIWWWCSCRVIYTHFLRWISQFLLKSGSRRSIMYSSGLHKNTLHCVWHLMSNYKHSTTASHNNIIKAQTRLSYIRRRKVYIAQPLMLKEHTFAFIRRTDAPDHRADCLLEGNVYVKYSHMVNGGMYVTWIKHEYMLYVERAFCVSLSLHTD